VPRPIIEVENVSKRYRLGLFNAQTLRDEIEDLFRRMSTSRRASTNKSEFWALKNVSFTVQRGEVVGIIGRNGAGKSTLLKVLSRVTEPTSGMARIRGRVASLLEVGTGFHPELTGRENIYLNGAILGMTKQEIREKFNDIVAFSEIEKFLDTPVKRYSSGMYVRLAFAVAAHLDPEILIVDEVLSVGDTRFQQKCLGKLRDVSSSGRTVLFVSHNLAAVQALCDRTMLLDRGKLLSIGSPPAIIAEYHNLDLVSGENQAVGLAGIERPAGMQTVIVDAAINGSPIKGNCKVLPESSLELVFHVSLATKMSDCTLGIHFETKFGVVVFSLNTRWAMKGIQLEQGRYEITALLERLPLMIGVYDISIGFSSNKRQVDWLERIAELEVTEFDLFGTGELPWPGQGYVISRPIWNVRLVESSI